MIFENLDQCSAICLGLTNKTFYEISHMAYPHAYKRNAKECACSRFSDKICLKATAPNMHLVVLFYEMLKEWMRPYSYSLKSGMFIRYKEKNSKVSNGGIE
jgi:hypothetical protein